MYAKRTIPAWLKPAGELAQRQWLKDYNLEKNAVYLTDPRANKKIDKIIHSEVIPIIQEFFSHSRFRLLGGFNFNIQQEYMIWACRSVHISFEDPTHPNHPETHPGWCCHTKFSCTLRECQIRGYHSLSLPADSDFNLITDLLSETSRGGLPSKLSISGWPNKKDFFDVVFESGGHSRYPITNFLKKKLAAYTDFIEAACELISQPNDPVLFRRMIREVKNIDDCSKPY